MNREIDVFEGRNVRLINDKIYCLFGEDEYIDDFPYKTYQEMESAVRNIKAVKIGTNNDIDENFEKRSITFPISLAFDYGVLSKKRIPTYKEVVDMYIKLSLEDNGDGTYTERKKLGATFTVSYEAVTVRIHKGYYSFIREYMTFLALKEKLSKHGVTVFMNREDDYKGRIDIGVIYNNILYIIDTSVKTKRSDEFEQKKIDGTRRNMNDVEQSLMEKYSCMDYCRILVKANTHSGGNTYRCGEVLMYKTSVINGICNYILTNNTYGTSINADELV